MFLFQQILSAWPIHDYIATDACAILSCLCSRMISLINLMFLHKEHNKLTTVPGPSRSSTVCRNEKSTSSKGENPSRCPAHLLGSDEDSEGNESELGWLFCRFIIVQLHKNGTRQIWAANRNFIQIHKILISWPWPAKSSGAVQPLYSYSHNTVPLSQRTMLLWTACSKRRLREVRSEGPTLSTMRTWRFRWGNTRAKMAMQRRGTSPSCWGL